MQSDNVEVKRQKTGLVFAFANLLVLPVVLIDERVGLLVAIAANAYLLHHLHELGKTRRMGNNMLTRVNTFFSSQLNTTSNETYNWYRNVINGGAAKFDEFTRMLTR